MEIWLSKISPSLRIVGNAPTRTGWIEPMRYIYEHELVLFEQADYAVEFTAKKIDCPAGSFIIVPPGTRHTSRMVSRGSGHRYWIHFDWCWQSRPEIMPVITYCPAHPRDALFRPAPDFVPHEILHGTIKNLRPVFELFARIENLFNYGSGKEKLVSRALAMELLLELLTPDTENMKTEDVAVRLASKIRNQLQKLADQPVNEAAPVQNFLAKSGLSYAHQCRIFKQNYGISPLQYVTELRMTRIKNLLRDTAHPISAIAAMSGFDNLGYFSRAFKKNTGMTPRDYRCHGGI